MLNNNNENAVILALKKHSISTCVSFSVNFIMKKIVHKNYNDGTQFLIILLDTFFCVILISILQLEIDGTVVFLSILSDSVFCMIILINGPQLRISDAVNKYHRQCLGTHGYAEVIVKFFGTLSAQIFYVY